MPNQPTRDLADYAIGALRGLCTGAAVGLAGIWAIVLVIGVPLLSTSAGSSAWLSSFWGFLLVGVVWGIPAGAIAGLIVGLGIASSHIRQWWSAFGLGAIAGGAPFVVISPTSSAAPANIVLFDLLWLAFVGVVGTTVWRLRPRERAQVVSIIAR